MPGLASSHLPNKPTGDQTNPRRRIDPVTALGLLIILASLTFIVTYLGLILPGKLSAQAGPPEKFVVAATMGIRSTGGYNPAEAVANITDTPSLSNSPELTPTFIPEDVNSEEKEMASVANPFSGNIIQFDPTANPRGNWPLPDYVEPIYWLSIPNINLEAPIIALTPREQDYGGQTLMRLPVPNSYSISWDITSAAPFSGGNTIMTGHNNLYGGVFQNLQYLQPGWEIAIWSQYGVHSYFVTDVIYLPEDEEPVETRIQNAQYMAQSGYDVLTLITCWPNEQSTHRLIVLARP